MCVSLCMCLCACAYVRMCVLTENVRAGADSVHWDTGELCFINMNHCVYIRHKLRIGGKHIVSMLSHTHMHKLVHIYVGLCWKCPLIVFALILGTVI